MSMWYVGSLQVSSCEGLGRLIVSFGLRDQGKMGGVRELTNMGPQMTTQTERPSYKTDFLYAPILGLGTRM